MAERVVIAIGALSNLLDLQVACFGTLSRLIKQGIKGSLIIAHGSSGESSKKNRKLEALIQKSAETIGISSLHFAIRFDYSSTSQDNVNVLRSFVESSHASVAIIPFIRTNDPRWQVLAESSLLACRSITNILMYSDAKSNIQFTPNLFSRLPEECLLLKGLCIDNFRDHYSGDNAELIVEEKLGSLPRSNAHDNLNTNSKYFEAFAVHRLVLLSSNQILE